jgi:hypothetical protein
MKDWTSGLVLLASFFQNTPVLETGATYRVSYDYWGMSCQYWDPDSGMKYMAPTENPYVTGVGSALWKGSWSCGQCLLVSYKNRSKVVVITDYCPPPCSPNQLDLDPETSAYLANSKTPRNYKHRELTVRKVGCKWGKKPWLYLHKDSSIYVWYIIPLFFETPPFELSVLNIKASHDLYGRFVVSFSKTKPRCNTTYKILVNRKNTLFLNFDCTNDRPAIRF